MDKKFISLVAIFFLVFGLFISLIIFEDPLIKFTKAKQDIAPSAEKSLLFAWPLEAPADSKTNIVITVFLRTQNGDEVSNKQVRLTTTLGQLQPQELIVDKGGKAEFRLTSNKEGYAIIQGHIEGLTEPVKQQITVKFNPI